MWKVLHKDNNRRARGVGEFIVRINDGYCEYEYYFKRADGKYRISDVARVVELELQADIVGKRLIKTNFNI